MAALSSFAGMVGSTDNRLHIWQCNSKFTLLHIQMIHTSKVVVVRRQEELVELSQLFTFRSGCFYDSPSAKVTPYFQKVTPVVTPVTKSRPEYIQRIIFFSFDISKEGLSLFIFKEKI